MPADPTLCRADGGICSGRGFSSREGSSINGSEKLFEGFRQLTL
jgi:hypothetical protein